MDNQLRELSQRIQQHQYDAARAPLQAYIKANPDSAYAWYLLSFAENTPARKQSAIANAVKLAPDNQRFHQRYVKLGATPKRSRLPLIGLAVVLLAIVGAAVVLLSNRQTAESQNLPTLAALNPTTENSQAAQTTLEIQPSVESSPTPPSPTAAEIVLTPVLTISSTLAEVVRPTLLPTNAVNVAAITATVAAPQVVVPTATTAQIIEPTATTEIIVTLVGERPTLPVNNNPTQIVPTNTPFPSPTAAPPQPTATLIPPGSTVPLATFGDIGVGELQVIQVARPGSGFIQEIGGSAPNPPANQDWVLLEILLMCSTASNCAPAPANLSILGSSGATYSIPGTLQIDPPFGPEAYSSGQVWGFAGFLVPRSESTLSLVVTQGDQSFAFALQ